MVVRRTRGAPWKDAKRGQMMPIFALTLVVFIGALALGIDLSRLRMAAENAQRAANAAALAGVVFLPDYQDNAYTRAQEEARKNGFVDGQNNVIVTPQRVSGYTGRLKVTITQPTSLIFGQILGLGPKTISRTATAEYNQPLQMGAPDYVLGYAPFPTSLVNGTSGQGFYLEARGPYGLQENGDAYSQYYESYKGSTFNAASATAQYDTNACTTSSGTTTADGCLGLQANPDRKAASFQYYDYVVYNPFPNNPLIIKIFDPYDEGAFNRDSGSSLQNQSIVAPFGNKFPDQFGCTNGGTHFCDKVQPTDQPSPYPVALKFSLYGPYQTLADSAGAEITTQPTTTVPCPPAASQQDCVIAPDFTTGDDPTHTACIQHVPQNCASVTSPYAYKFLNYAIIYGKGYYHIHVHTDANADPLYSGKYGTGGNIFGLAACSAVDQGATTGASHPVLGTFTDPSDGGLAVSDPYNKNGTSAGGLTSYWNGAGCPNPNPTSSAQTACGNAATAPPEGCVHIFAVGRMCIYSNIQGGSYSSPSPSLIPPGYVPGDYEGKTLQIRLFDVGDVTGGCQTTGGTTTCNNTIQVLTPAGNLAYNAGDQVNTTANLSNGGYPSNLPYSYSAAPTDAGSTCGGTGSGAGFICQPETSQLASQVINVGGATWNGSWLTIKVPLVLTGYSHSYADMVTNFGGYWKMLYNIAGTGNDTTTWEISINGAPVHLVQNGA